MYLTSSSFLTMSRAYSLRKVSLLSENMCPAWTQPLHFSTFPACINAQNPRIKAGLARRPATSTFYLPLPASLTGMAHSVSLSCLRCYRLARPPNPRDGDFPFALHVSAGMARAALICGTCLSGRIRRRKRLYLWIGRSRYDLFRPFSWLDVAKRRWKELFSLRDSSRQLVHGIQTIF
jgi:hypothetical protein